MPDITGVEVEGVNWREVAITAAIALVVVGGFWWWTNGRKRPTTDA